MVIFLRAPCLGTAEKMLTLRLLTCFLQLLAGLALPTVSPQPLALSAENNSTQPPTTVMPFQVVWSRSYCRPRVKLVDILSEYPHEVQYLFSPSCVPLLRCTGCCGDEALRCVPEETANVTMQIVRTNTSKQTSYVDMTFTQHTHCECRPLPQKAKPERRKPRGSGKRKKEKQRSTDGHLLS